MNDHSEDAGETPMERALRLRKAEIEAKAKPQNRGKVQRASGAAPAGSSKPWLKK